MKKDEQNPKNNKLWCIISYLVPLGFRFWLMSCQACVVSFQDTCLLFEIWRKMKKLWQKQWST